MFNNKRNGYIQITKTYKIKVQMTYKGPCFAQLCASILQTCCGQELKHSTLCILYCRTELVHHLNHITDGVHTFLPTKPEVCMG